MRKSRKYLRQEIHVGSGDRKVVIDTRNHEYSVGARIAKYTLQQAFHCLSKPLKSLKTHPAWDVMAGNGVITATMLDDPLYTEVYGSDVDGHAINRMRQFITDSRSQIFEHNILASAPRNIANDLLHIAVVDPPYDHQCHWLDDNNNQITDPSRDDQLAMLELAFMNILPKMSPGGVLALMHKMHLGQNELERITQATFIEQHRLTSGGSSSYLYDRNLYLLRK